MDNQIILYDKQTVDCLIYSLTSFTEEEKNKFDSSQTLSWEDYSVPQIICNFNDNLLSSNIEQINDTIKGYEISKKRPEESSTTSVGVFSTKDLEESLKENIYHIIDFNVKNNNKYTYYIFPMAENIVQSPVINEIITKWNIFTLTPIVPVEGKKNEYEVPKDEFGNYINWGFQLNCSEGDIVLNQDKTTFTSFASKPKISLGDLNYYSGNFSCLLGNTLYNDEYYEPNVLLEKWDKMLKENYIYLFKNAKGETMVVSLENETKKKYMNEIANYYEQSYNNNLAITNRPTTIEFSYIEILDSNNITVYGI